MRRVYCMVFSLVKRRREKPRRTLEEVVRRDFMINNISEASGIRFCCCFKLLEVDILLNYLF